jgi:hypothetical protein
MGIYPNHGIEYWIEIDKVVDNNTLKNFIENLKSETNLNMYVTKINNICVLSTARTDDRLVKSKYYEDRKSDWFHHRTCLEEWRELIEEQSLIDIEITKSEMNVINKIKEQFNEHISFEGWFDVNTIGYSY